MKNQPKNNLAGRLGKQAAYLALGIVALSQTARSVPSYQSATLAQSPVAFWQLNETDDPSTGLLSAIDASGNGLNGTYGAAANNGYNSILGPQPPPFNGFTNGQGALLCSSGNASSVVTLPALNLSATTVDTTILMWINPNAQPPASGGLLFDRSGGAQTAGFGFSGAQSGGLTSLGYNWNDSNGSWGWNSSLYPQLNTWSLVALVIETNQATMYLDYIDPITSQTNLLSQVHANTHTAVTWSGAGPRWLGGDQNNANRTFPGSIAGVAIFNKALTGDQVTALFAAGLGVSGFSPTITGQPQSQYIFSGAPAQLSATGINGTSPITYQWQLNGTNINLLADSANFTGAQSNVLTVLSMTAADAGSYHLVLNNSYGTTVSSNATLSIASKSLVGKWFTNSTLADVSGYQPAGTHDGYDVAGTGSYVFTNDVPPGNTGSSILLYNGDTGIAISNTSTMDVNYTNTFDNVINNSMTVGLWVKGWPSGWNPFVSKWGESGEGWQLRSDGNNGVSPCWTIRGAGGTVVQGTGVYGNPEDMAATGSTFGNDGNWHLYIATFDASTGLRNIYVDGVLGAQETNNHAYNMAQISHLCLGARDTNGVIDGTTFFTGEMHDVRVYNYALSQAEVLNWLGVVSPFISLQPKSTGVFAGYPVQLKVNAGGTPPLTYQWQLNGTNIDLLADATNFIGGTSNVLSILSLTANDVGMYRVVVNSTLGYGSVTSSNAFVSIVTPSLLGQWFTNGTLTELSGHTPAGTHDAYAVGGANYYFTNDVPLGENGQSIQFGSTWDSGVAIANSATSDGATYTNTFDVSELTVAFWAKGRGGPWYSGKWDAWVAKGGYNNNGEYNNVGWSVGMEAYSQNFYFDMEGIDGGGIGYTLGDGLWGNGILETGKTIPGDDSWHHYATTYNPTTRYRRMYFDGVLVAEQTNDAAYTKAPDKHLTISCQEQTSHGFVGFSQSAMFDVRVYNYALTASQIGLLLPQPIISVQPPQARNAYVGVTAHIPATVTTFNKPVTNQWQFNGTNLTDGPFEGATISGANSTVLTIANVTTNMQGVYRLVVSFSSGVDISSNCVITVLQPMPVPATNLVGAWLTGGATLADVSGYQPAHTHDAHGVAGAGLPSFGYAFTNDVPPGQTGVALTFQGNTALAISNSSSMDMNYTNTFDDTIDTNGMTIICWAKGLPGSWNPWVSKYGESGQGWQLRVNGDGATPCWTVRGTGGAEDMSSTIGQSDGNWHQYAGTYNPVTGIRSLYVDGVLAATQSGQGPLYDSTSSYLAIGGRDGGGNNFGNYFTGKIYGVRIYNVDLSEAQVNTTLLPTTPKFTGPPVIIGKNIVFSWSNGSLLQSTNLMGPWTTVTGATSPFTNDTTTAAQMFYKLSQ